MNKKAKKVLSIIILTILIFMSCVKFNGSNSVFAQQNILPSGITYDEINQKIDDFLNEHKDNNAAVATAVFSGETDIYKKYFGVLNAGGLTLDETSVLEWGSTSKLLVWLSAYQLVEKGSLDLNADIKKYLPEGFLRNLKFDKKITMLDLMNHSAGFQETTFVLEVEDEKDIIPLGEYLKKYQPIQVFEPGSVVAYSNWGAALAGYIVECISGMEYYNYVKTNIFTPLGMNHTAINSSLDDNEYVQEKRKDFVSYMPDGTLSEENNKVYILPYPAGMCTSTLDDFVTFAKALLVKDSRLLTLDSFNNMYSPSLYYTGTNVARVCHGFLVDYDFNVAVIGHDGNTMGGSSRLMLDFENNIGMVMLTNQLGGNVYRTKMAEIVFGTAERTTEIDGYYIPARNVFVGKQKLFYNRGLIDACHITSKMLGNMYVNVISDRFEISTCDYLVPTHNYQLEDTIATIWFILTVYSFISLLSRLIFMAICLIKKHKYNIQYIISIVYNALVAFSIINLLPSIPALFALIYTIILSLATIGMIIYLILKAKEMIADKNGLFNFIHIVTLFVVFAVTILNVIIWNLTYLGA